MKRPALLLGSVVLGLPFAAFLVAGLARGPAATPAGAAAAPDAPAPTPAPDGPRAEAVVGLGDADLHGEAARLAEAVEGEVVRVIAPLRCAVVRAPGDGPALASRLAAAGAAWTEVNRTAAPAGGRGRCTCQGPPKYQPPALGIHDLAGIADHLRLEEAWYDAEGRGEGVLVGVVDTGVDGSIDALDGACEAGVDLVTPGAQAIDEHGHGTSMAGIIAGRGDGSSGFRGVAPAARILPVRVADARGGGPLDRVARGIVAAVDRGARVVYVGVGVRGPSPTLSEAVAYARGAGALVVCPTGNDALDQVRSPAAAEGALAVAGVSDHDALALTANVDPDVRLAAPAEFVPAPVGDEVRFTDGTSSSAALAAGVAALGLGRAPDLDVDALERCLVAGAAPLGQVAGTALAGRLAVRSLDAAGAVARARAGYAEVGIDRVEVSPDPPVAGEPAAVRVLVANRGHVGLEGLDLAVAVDGDRLDAPPLPTLGVGESTWAELDWTPAAGQVEAGAGIDAAVRATPARPDGAGGPVAPVAARGYAPAYPTAAALPNLAIARVELTEPMTLDRPHAAFAVTVANRGAAPARGVFHAAVNGERREEVPTALAPGEETTHVVRWTAPDGRPPAAPVTLEAYVEDERDCVLEDDLDVLTVSLQDPALPVDPMYRQAGDVDFGVDAPWRLAGDRGHLPLLVFVPSIGRPSRYATFHETLALRRGLVARAGTSARTGGRVRAAGGRLAGNFVTYTAAMFVKELGDAIAADEEDAVRRFVDKVAKADFMIDFGLYSVGAWTGARAFDAVHSRAANIRGLRWTGTNLGGTIARAQATIALGYLLPNIVRGRYDRRVFIDLGAIGVSTAFVESLAHLARVGATRTALGAGVASWLARHGRIARAGGWAVEVGKLVIILYASEWIANNIDRPLIRWEARKAIRSGFADLSEAALEIEDEADDEAFEAALKDMTDAFDAYRNLQVQAAEGAVRDLNGELSALAEDLHEIEQTRSATERLNVPGAIRERAARRLDARKSEVEAELKRVLASFEDRYAEALAEAYDTESAATLDAPGDSKPAVYELELELLEEVGSAVAAEVERLEGAVADLEARRADGAVVGEALRLARADLEKVEQRRELLAQKVITTRRLRDLDIDLMRSLTRGASVGAPVRPEQLAGTDGLRLKRVTIKARDSFHVETDEAEAVAARPNKYAPEGAVAERVIYEHDTERELYRAAPGVVRLDELARPQESVALLDAPRPLTMKGRYNILRIPRELLEPLAVGGTVYLHVDIDWELTKVVRGQLMRPAEGSYAQMLKVDLGEDGLPRLSGLEGGYLDAHYHTIAEWYNPEPGFVSDLELDAPRQKYGGPIPMLVETAWAVGAIPAPTFQAARDRLITTDHNAFYVDRGPGSDDLTNRPPFGPTAAREAEGRSEHEQMRHLLGESVGEELCYEKPGISSVGVHMLDYRSRHYDGTWNAKEPVTRFWKRWTDPLEIPTMERILGDFAEGGPGNEDAFAYASHPVSSIPWADEKLRAALTEYVREDDQSFPFKGMQVWNMRAARHHAGNKLYKWLDDLNPFVSRTWQAGAPFDEDIHGALVKYRYLLQDLSAFRLPTDPTVRMVRKHYIVAGSDAHGDFNYSVGGLATVITALLGTNDRTDDTLELSDGAFMKIRNFVATDGYARPEFMNALAHGSSAVTDGPLVWFEVDGDGRFDAGEGVVDLRAPLRFADREGRIGGAGPFDGGRTVLLANDARPVIRYSYTNHPEFGRPIQRDELGRVLRRDGGLDVIAVYKTDREGGSFTATGHRIEADGTLDTHGGLEFGRVFHEPLDPAEEGPVRTISAIQLGCTTSTDGNTSPADVYRCYTNPVWAVRLEATAHVDPAAFDPATGVIAPGGLTLEVASPISLRQDRVELLLKAIGPDGRSGPTIGRLVGQGWADGVDEAGVPYAGGRYLAANDRPLELRGLPVFGAEEGAAKVTLAAITRQVPRDHFGNALNRVAVTFEVDPADGAPGAHADAATDLPDVAFPDEVAPDAEDAPADGGGTGLVRVLEGARARITGQGGVALHRIPDRTSPVRGTLPAGAEVLVTGQRDGWVEVEARVDGEVLRGYVPRGELEELGD